MERLPRRVSIRTARTRPTRSHHLPSLTASIRTARTRPTRALIDAGAPQPPPQQHRRVHGRPAETAPQPPPPTAPAAPPAAPSPPPAVPPPADGEYTHGSNSPDPRAHRCRRSSAAAAAASTRPRQTGRDSSPAAAADCTCGSSGGTLAAARRAAARCVQETVGLSSEAVAHPSMLILDHEPNHA